MAYPLTMWVAMLAMFFIGRDEIAVALPISSDRGQGELPSPSS